MAERKPVVLVSGQLKELPAGDTLPPQAPASHSHATSDVTGLDAALSGKEPAISAGTTAQYWRGDKTWRDFFTDVRAATLTGLSTATNAVIDAADTVLAALGKLQAQVNHHSSLSANAHPASAISVAAAEPATSHSIPAGSVQALLATNWQDVGGLMEWQEFHTSGAGTQHPASTISNTPAGDIAATNVQAAINELDVEKFSKSGGDIGGNVRFTGSGRRITGEFSDPTISNRVLFQTNTLNAGTALSAIPNGTGLFSQFSAHSKSDPDNSSVGNLSATATDIRLVSTLTGTGAYLPLTFHAGGAERLRIDPATGNVLVTGGGALGYGVGSGGTATQDVSKGTAVTLNKPCGRIQMHPASLAAGASVEFAFNNSTLNPADGLVVNPDGFVGYSVEVAYFNTSTQVILRVTNKGATRSDTLNIVFRVIKGAFS